MTMMLQVLGVLCLVIAAGAFVFYMRTSYVTQGGSQGQVPCVAAAAIQVPLLTMLGLSLLDKTTLPLDLAWWHWLSIWLAETLLVAAAAIWIGNVASRKSQAGRHDRQTLRE
ncbi:hypothetical protein [Sulfuritalea hydrogenivorans]|jgi:hypothetical protein|nr:hypothetical protein [Sulfuritalea hydrogenivorans]MDK9716230.1 hypothetical protein [Sulfuritalea sp.]